MHDLVVFHVFHQDIADVFSFYETNVISIFLKKDLLSICGFSTCTELKVGQYLTSQVEEVKNDGRMVQLSANLTTIAQTCAEPKQGWNLTTLLPGLLVKATIKEVKTVFLCYPLYVFCY